jgi:hypothetical protein
VARITLPHVQGILFYWLLSYLKNIYNRIEQIASIRNSFNAI